MISVCSMLSRSSFLSHLMELNSDKRPQINTTLLGHELLSSGSSNFKLIRDIQTITRSSTSTSPVTAQVNASTLSALSTNIAAETQSAKLGIQKWYSLNILSVCEGSYAPSASVLGATFNLSSCKAQTPMSLHPWLS